MAKVIRLQPSFHDSKSIYNHETSDLTDTKYQKQIAKTSQETHEALNHIPGINAMKLTEKKKREIYATLGNPGVTLHPNTIKVLEQEAERQAHEAFDPTAVEQGLSKDEIAKELEFIASNASDHDRKLLEEWRQQEYAQAA